MTGVISDWLRWIYNNTIPETDDPPRDWLTPLGDTGFWVTPNTPADPFDCDRYPNSPYCGRFVSPLFGLIRNPLGIGVGIHRSECEVCVDVNLIPFLIPLPPYSICYRFSGRAGCGGSRGGSDGGAGSIGPRDPFPDGCIRWFTVMDFGTPRNFVPGRDRVPRPQYVVAPAPSPDFDISPYEINWVEIFRAGERPALTLTTGQPAGYDEALYLIRYRTRNRDGQPYEEILSLGWRPATYPEPQFVRFYLREDQPESCTPVFIPPPPPPIPFRREDDDMCDCAEMTEIMRLIAARLGVQDYPVRVPQFLVRSGNDNQQRIESLTEFVSWLTYQVDGLVGEFPVRIEVEDIDPTEEGNQSVNVRLPNIAEALAELYGLAAKSAINSDIHTNFLMRLAAEAVATKNAAIVTQDYAKANAAFLGYEGNPKKRKIPYAFDAQKLDSLETILNSTVGDVIGWENTGKDTALEFFRELMFAGGIIKAVHFRRAADIARLVGEVGSALGVGDVVDERQDEEWRDYIEGLNDPNSDFNRNAPTRPIVRDPRLGQNGNNQNQGGGS